MLKWIVRLGLARPLGTPSRVVGKPSLRPYMACGFVYDWELREGEQIVATGRIYEDARVEVGASLTLGSRTLVVRDVLPAGQQQHLEGRLILVKHT